MMIPTLAVRKIAVSLYLIGMQRASVYERTEDIKISAAFFSDYKLPIH